MKLWILDDKHFPTGYANGLIEKKYPERKKLYLACTTADIFGGGYELIIILVLIFIEYVQLCSRVYHR